MNRPTDLDRAPDLSPGYPSRGSQIGPAWQEVWNRLADGEWHMRLGLVGEVARRHGLTTHTLEQIAQQAVRKGVLAGRLTTGRLAGSSRTRTRVEIARPDRLDRQRAA